MGGINTTGERDTNNYFIGRGKIFMASLDTTTDKPLSGFREVGNISACEASFEVEELKHEGTDKKKKYTDATVIISEEGTMTMSLDEVLNFENLALYFGGKASTVDAAGKAAITRTLVQPTANLNVLDHYYLEDPTTKLALTQIDKANLTIYGVASVGTALTDVDDYAFDQGRLRLTSAGLAKCTEGLYFEVAEDTGLGTVDVVTAQTDDSNPYVAINLESKNALDNSDYLTQIPKATVRADAALGFISDEFTPVGLVATIELSKDADFTFRTITK